MTGTVYPQDSARMLSQDYHLYCIHLYTVFSFVIYIYIYNYIHIQSYSLISGGTKIEPVTVTSAYFLILLDNMVKTFLAW